MTEAFDNKLKDRLRAYREWTSGKEFSRCEIVHYCGVQLVGSVEIALSDVEERITALICEAFYVDWAEHQQCLVLRVWEYGGPEPSWQQVFAHEHLADMATIQKEIGQNE